MEIEKKEYLGRADIITMELAEETTSIGDWAFAKCPNLKNVMIPDTIEHIGRDVFLDCKALKSIHVYHGSHLPGGETGLCTAALRADALHLKMGIPLQKLICSSLHEWITEWDNALLAVLKKPEDEGYVPFYAGGEEDYEEGDEARKEYAKKRRIMIANAITDRFLLANASPEAECDDVFLNEAGGFLTDSLAGDSAAGLFSEREVLIRETVELYFEKGYMKRANIPGLLDGLSGEKTELRSLIMRHSSVLEGDIFSI
ncbi:MAG: leucine-rich repeat protein [Lachnospiraceae bacterium]|nr:leucine-rich repeat protein [Lachnospiraceae bacterium]